MSRITLPISDLKRRYEEAVVKDQKIIEIEEAKLDVGYAKYLIEWLDNSCAEKDAILELDL
jgi:hypothetical protein